MNIGNIDGLGRIYHPTGQLLLYNGENVLFYDANSNALDISTKWSGFMCYNLYDSNAGKGNFYVTNLRLIHIRKPDVFKAGKRDMVGSTPYHYGASKMARAKRILRMGGLEYCEIRYSDCVNYKTKRWGVFLYIQGNELEYNQNLKEYGVDKDNKYHSIVLSKPAKPIIIQQLQRYGVQEK